MRKILYPIFLLAVLASIFYFFGENFSPLIQKGMFIMVIILLFFLFRGILLFFLGFLFQQFSSILKYIFLLLFFLVIAAILWTVASEETKNSIKNIFSNTNPLQKEVQNYSTEIESNNEENRTPSHLLERIQNIHEDEKKNEKKKKEISPLANNAQNNKIDTDTSKNQETQRQEEKSSKEKSKNEQKDVEDNTPTSSWKKPVIQEEEKKKKKESVNLVNAGPSDEYSSVLFREADAQIVFPKEYTVSHVVWTDNDKTLDQLNFTLKTNTQTTAQISIKLFNEGEKYTEEFERFTALEKNENNRTENIFYANKKKNNTIVYSTFFEGILWEINITIAQKNEEKTNEYKEKDFYDILLPWKFEKKD